MKVLTWIPSIPVVFFFMQNAFEKILFPEQLDKMGLSNDSLIIIGIILLFATALFLVEKTKVIGTIVLSLYMMSVVIIHILEGKPFFLALLIVLLVVFASYIRSPKFIPMNR